MKRATVGKAPALTILPPDHEEAAKEPSDEYVELLREVVGDFRGENSPVPVRVVSPDGKVYEGTAVVTAEYKTEKDDAS